MTVEIRNLRKGSLHNSMCNRLRHIKMLPCLSIVQALEGAYEVRLDNGSLQRVEAGAAFIAPRYVRQDITHYVSESSGYMSARWIFLEVTVEGAYLEDVFELPPVFPDPGIPRRFFGDLFASDDGCDSMIAAYRLVQALLPLAKRKERLPDGMRDVLSFLRMHFREKITIRQLADILHLSESAFYPVFRRYTGQTAVSYLNTLRLTEAASLLKSTRSTITEIAGASGFSNVFYFSNQFKKQYGCSPRTYREQDL